VARITTTELKTVKQAYRYR